MRRTSVTHPLQIATASAGPDFGRVGITFCPGKYDPNAKTGDWDRDLSIDLDAIRDWGAAAVVTLLEPKELRLLRVDRLGEEIRRRGMAWFHLPIVDVSTPDEGFERNWASAGDELRALLRIRRDVLVHCRGGLGRAGTIAARLLIELGMEPTAAISHVRALRNGAIETVQQEKYVRELRAAKARTPERTANWFERITGFTEMGYDETRSRLAIDGDDLRSRVTDQRVAVGRLEVVSLQTLRERVASRHDAPGRLTVQNVSGDVRRMHQSRELTGALFQVASQFNLLEMVSPNVTPEQGVTRYEGDRTQGPACAIAAGAATIYRNYFMPVSGGEGQTAERQVDCLAAIGAALATALAQPADHLWTMKNGYALCTAEGLRKISGHIDGLDPAAADGLRGSLQIGIHQDVEVTDGDAHPPQLVSQAFCSALPVAYCGHPSSMWRPFAKLVLDAAYEATVLAAVLNARRGASRILLLTRLGGGAFGNDDAWIDAAMRRALDKVRAYDLDVRLVSFGSPPRAMLETEEIYS